MGSLDFSHKESAHVGLPSRQGREAGLKTARLFASSLHVPQCACQAKLSENSSPTYSTAEHSSESRAAMIREKTLPWGTEVTLS